jgi:hypothetical protein
VARRFYDGADFVKPLVFVEFCGLQANYDRQKVWAALADTLFGGMAF